MFFFVAHHTEATCQVSYFKYINLHYSNIYDDDDVTVTDKQHSHDSTEQKYQAAMTHN